MIRPIVFIKRLLPARAKSILRRIVYLPQDALSSLTGRRDSYTPPRGIMFIGTADFKKVGDEFFGYFTRLGGLKPEDRVLDVGCGLGRMAVPLLDYLKEPGSYDGFDVVPVGIKWATRAITPRHPNFRFQVADISNKYYNPRGRVKASEYVFPYPDATFDFVFLGSVFTHLLPQDMERFLSEIVRVLKPRGRALITYFLLNPESRGLIAAGKSTQNFKHPIGNGMTVTAATPEAAMAYPEELIRALYASHGLSIHEPVSYGSWCGRDAFTSYQDMMVATKE